MVGELPKSGRLENAEQKKVNEHGLRAEVRDQHCWVLFRTTEEPDHVHRTVHHFNHQNNELAFRGSFLGRVIVRNSINYAGIHTLWLHNVPGNNIQNC